MTTARANRSEKLMPSDNLAPTTANRMAPVFLVARPEVDGPVETVDACLSEREEARSNVGLKG